MNEAMRECPFCGENPIISHDMPLRGCVTVCCVNSACRIKPRATENSLREALKAWNTRAEKGIEQNMIAKIVEEDREKLKFEECKNCEDWTGCITDCVNTCEKPLDALEEFNAYKALKEQGKLLKLPCKLGDITFWISDEDAEGNKIPTIRENAPVVGIAVQEDGFYVLCDVGDEYQKAGGKMGFPHKRRSRSRIERVRG